MTPADPDNVARADQAEAALAELHGRGGQVPEAAIRSAIRETEYKYFGDYEMSEGQRAAVDTLVSVARAALAARPVAQPEQTKGGDAPSSDPTLVPATYSDAPLANDAGGAKADPGDVQPLCFIYRNHRGELGLRRARPISVRYGTTKWHPELGWLMRAYDLDQRAEREFAMLDMGASADARVADAVREERERCARIAEIDAFQTVRRIVGPTILLSSGSYFDFEAPETSAFTIEDIAHSLAMICRFAGHCCRFYSVAQHSVHCSHLVAREYAYAALMHDAPEAFVGDVAKPLKVMLPDYKVIEDRVEAAVFARFDVPSPLPAAVKEIDAVMLVTEQRQLMHNRDDWDYTRGRRPANIVIPAWSPEEAKDRFLARYHEVRS